MRPRQNGRRFVDDTFKRIFLNENVKISISLKFVPKGPINNNPAIMAWRRSGDKPLSEPMMVSIPTHICVTRPQWVKWIGLFIYGHIHNEIIYRDMERVRVLFVLFHFGLMNSIWTDLSTLYLHFPKGQSVNFLMKLQIVFVLLSALSVSGYSQCQKAKKNGTIIQENIEIVIRKPVCWIPRKLTTYFW